MENVCILQLINLLFYQIYDVFYQPSYGKFQNNTLDLKFNTKNKIKLDNYFEIKLFLNVH